MGIIDQIDKYLTDTEEWKRSSHYASDITACRRQLFYKWKGVERTNPPVAGAMWKMAMGVKAEEIIADALRWMQAHDMIEAISEQVRGELHPEVLKYPIRCKADFVFEANDQRIGIEMKTSYGRGISEIQKKGAPKIEHVMQVYVTMLLTGLPIMYLIYFGRDNGYRTEFVFKMAEDFKSLIMNGGKRYVIDFDGVYIPKLKTVEEALEADEEPGRDFVHAIKGGELRDKFTKDKVEYKTDWQCSYCDWKDKCWKPVLEQYAEGSNTDMFGEADDEPTDDELKDF